MLREIANSVGQMGGRVRKDFRTGVSKGTVDKFDTCTQRSPNILLELGVSSLCFTCRESVATHYHNRIFIESIELSV
jgi:hypothetical protein